MNRFVFFPCTGVLHFRLVISLSSSVVTIFVGISLLASTHSHYLRIVLLIFCLRGLSPSLSMVCMSLWCEAAMTTVSDVMSMSESSNCWF